MNINIPFNKKANDVSCDELNNLLIKGSFKGLGVARLSRALNKNPELNLIYDRDTHTFYYENGKKALELIKLERRRGTLSSKIHNFKCRHLSCYRKPHEEKIQILSNKLFEIASQEKSISIEEMKRPPLNRLIKIPNNFQKEVTYNGNINEISLIDNEIITISDKNVPSALDDLIFNRYEVSQEWFEQLPEEQQKRIRLLLELPELVSDYSFGTIKILPSSLIAHPAYHLHQFIKMNIDFFTVRFLNEDLEPTEGMGSSLRRQYLTDLVRGITKIDAFSPMASSLLMPRGKLFKLSDSEREFFYDFGKLLKVFYINSDFASGIYFDDVLFTTIQSLLEREKGDVSDIAFGELPLQIDLCRVLINNLIIPINPKENILENHFSEILDLTLWVPGMPLPNDNVLNWAAMLIDNEDYFDLETCLPDIAKIKVNIEKLVENLPQAIFAYKINNVPLGLMLEPIYTIASAMNIITDFQYKPLSERIQGSLDRDLIAESIVIYQKSEHIEKKVQWLKEWIKDPLTTDEEIKQFLVFATGSPTSSTIEITQQGSDYNPVPIAHACFNELQLSPKPCGNSQYNDRTKEAFIALLKKFVLIENQDFNQM